MPFEFGSAQDKPAKSRKKSGFSPASANDIDPLATVAYTGNVEADAATELDALASAFRERRRDEDKRFQQATDSEYWFAVCFKSRAAKDEFLAAIKARRLGDKYIDGHHLARLLGVDLTDN